MIESESKDPNTQRAYILVHETVLPRAFQSCRQCGFKSTGIGDSHLLCPGALERAEHTSSTRVALSRIFALSRTHRVVLLLLREIVDNAIGTRSELRISRHLDFC